MSTFSQFDEGALGGIEEILDCADWNWGIGTQLVVRSLSMSSLKVGTKRIACNTSRTKQRPAAYITQLSTSLETRRSRAEMTTRSLKIQEQLVTLSRIQMIQQRS